jgi:hypothetical protein
VFCNASLKNKVIIVFHLTNFISKELLSTISKEIKYKIMKRTQEAFSAFYNIDNKGLNLHDTTRYCTLAVENTYPECFFLNYTILNLCHPNELIEYYYKALWNPYFCIIASKLCKRIMQYTYWMNQNMLDWQILYIAF